MQKIWQNINIFRRNGYPVLASNVADHAKILNEGNYVFITDELYLRTEITKSCDLQLGKDFQNYDYYAIALQNNSAYVDLFNEQ